MPISDTVRTSMKYSRTKTHTVLVHSIDVFLYGPTHAHRARLLAAYVVKNPDVYVFIPTISVNGSSVYIDTPHFIQASGVMAHLVNAGCEFHYRVKYREDIEWPTI